MSPSDSHSELEVGNYRGFPDAERTQAPILHKWQKNDGRNRRFSALVPLSAKVEKLIFRWFLGTIDDQHLRRPVLRLEFEPQLLLHRAEKGCLRRRIRRSLRRGFTFL